MSLMKSLKKNIVNAYRVWRSYDLKLIFHMILNRLKCRHFSNYLKADWSCKFQFLRRHYGHLLDGLKKSPVINTPNEGPVWVFWWQGEDNMPKIVSFCYDSIRKNIPRGRNLIFLHKENFRNYVDIPEYILKKLENGVISLTHFSDVLRMALLAEYGGLWIDSTVYVSGKISEDIFNKPYFSAKEPFRDSCVCGCQYTVYLLGAAAHAPWIVFARDFLYEYWKKSCKLLDYILINYILVLALDAIPELKKNVLSCVVNTPYINMLQNLRNVACNPDFYNRMMSECNFYKLSYKLDFKEYDEDGCITYYGMMTHGENKNSIQ